MRSPLTAFYLGELPDREGRMLNEIWLWDFDRLEFSHDYIQWLFPTIQKSNFNIYAPVLDSEVIADFQASDKLRANLLTSLKVMLAFYGLQYTEIEGAVKVTKAPSYPQRKLQWVSVRNHNYLRLTRILNSLMLLGLPRHAIALFKCLATIYGEEQSKVSYETYLFWRKAVERS